MSKNNAKPTPKTSGKTSTKNAAAKPAAKPAAKATAKLGAKPAAKPVALPDPRPAGKVATGKAAKSAEITARKMAVATPAVPAATVSAAGAMPAGKKAKGRAKDKMAELVNLSPPNARMDVETRKTRFKSLIKLGKERGYLTYAEINDNLPDDVVDAEQIESIISTFNDMQIKVFDEAPAEDLLLLEASPAAADEEEVEEQAEQALSTVDAEFGRTTDPVRMYMREMGSVELLTREGEIEIAKRIEEGLKHMVMAISACPSTVAEMLNLADKVAKGEMRIDELIDGLIDPSAVLEAELSEETEDEELELEVADGEEMEEDESAIAARNAAVLEQLKKDALERFERIRAVYAGRRAEDAGRVRGGDARRRLRDRRAQRLFNSHIS